MERVTLAKCRVINRFTEACAVFMVPPLGMQRLLEAVLLSTTRVPYLSPLFPTRKMMMMMMIVVIEHYSALRTV